MGSFFLGEWGGGGAGDYLFKDPLPPRTSSSRESIMAYAGIKVTLGRSLSALPFNV